MLHHNDTVALLRSLGERSNIQGVRPLVLFTSGCKDYGVIGLDGDQDMHLHTEKSPLNAPPFGVDRSAQVI